MEKYGVFKGLYYGTKRIGRCHPWNEGGVDEV
jgi:putative component of membrane protein insertase Oxa1/YidC/SpoIIIJ protein YidD